MNFPSESRSRLSHPEFFSLPLALSVALFLMVFGVDAALVVLHSVSNKFFRASFNNQLCLIVSRFLCLLVPSGEEGDESGGASHRNDVVKSRCQ